MGTRSGWSSGSSSASNMASARMAFSKISLLRSPPPSLFSLSLSLSCQKNECVLWKYVVFLLGFHAYANGDRCSLLLIVVRHCTLLDLDRRACNNEEG